MAEEKDVMAMSDEEIMNSAPPEIKEDEQGEQNNPEPETEPAPEEKEEQDSGEVQESEPAEEDSSGSNEEEQPESQPAQEPVDYKKFYTAMMSPIKANGKTLQVRTPDEAVRLMQMGANYTQKMQALAPYRKKMQMLNNAGLFEEDKINFLIDLAQGKPEAVSQFLKDKKIDPLELDMSEEAPKYVPGNHSVSDAEMNFQAVVDDLKSTPEGLDTLATVQGWDQASLEAVWKSPDVLTVINEQKQNGVFKTITDEIEHQKMIGTIPPSTPFLDAYQAVGNMLLQQKYQAQQQQAQQKLPQGTLKKVPNNNARAKAAGPSGRSKKSTTTFVDPFSLSDEEFEATFKNYSV